MVRIHLGRRTKQKVPKEAISIPDFLEAVERRRTWA